MKKVTMREPLVLSEEESLSGSEKEVPLNQILIEESEVMDVIPNTQAVEAVIEKEKTKKKKRKAEEQKAANMKKMKIDVEKEIKQASVLKNQGTHVSLLSLLLVIWTKEFLLHIPSTIETLICLSLKEKQYEAKKILHILMDSLQAAQKSLVHQKKELGTCSLNALVTFLLNSEWCTMYLEVEITAETSNWIANKYAENFMGPSCSSHTMETTSILSTIAPTPTIHADVPSCNIFQDKSIEDILEESFQVGSSRSSTGSICQSISKRSPGGICTLTSPGERGFQVVKLDVYDFSKISKKPKTEWWKEANYRSTFLTHSPLDPNHQLVMKILLSVTNQLMKIQGIKREERETK